VSPARVEVVVFPFPSPDECGRPFSRVFATAARVFGAYSRPRAEQDDQSWVSSFSEPLLGFEPNRIVNKPIPSSY